MVADLLKKIVKREGVGGLLAEGIRVASAELGLEDIAIHVKGMEPPGYDPRALKGMGLAYAVSDRGACHLRSTFYKPELAGMIDPEQIEGKAELFIDFEDRCTLFDCLGGNCKNHLTDNRTPAGQGRTTAHGRAGHGQYQAVQSPGRAYGRR